MSFSAQPPDKHLLRILCHPWWCWGSKRKQRGHAAGHRAQATLLPPLCLRRGWGDTSDSKSVLSSIPLPRRPGAGQLPSRSSQLQLPWVSWWALTAAGCVQPSSALQLTQHSSHTVTVQIPEEEEAFLGAVASTQPLHQHIPYLMGLMLVNSELSRGEAINPAKTWGQFWALAWRYT